MNNKKELKKELFIVVSGGIVQDVYGSPDLENCTVMVLDEDTQDPDEQDVVDDTVDDCINRVRNGELKCIY